MQDAAWFIVPFEPLGGGSVYGMLVEYDPNDALATRRAVGLVSALKRIGLEVHGPMASLPTSRISCRCFWGTLISTSTRVLGLRSAKSHCDNSL
jgi:hypothetical protein